MKFAGHESFHCRPLWLKKGYDQVSNNLGFKDEATIQLGVGKNMVASIRYWIKSFGLVDVDTEEILPISHLILGDDGWDPYIEDDGTIWLLHYFLVTTEFASIYSLIFNELRKKKPYFTEKNFQELVSEKGFTVSPKSLKTDFQAFTRTYLIKSKSKDLEDNYSGLLHELNLIQDMKSGYEITPTSRPEIPSAILLYCILISNPEESSMSFENLYSKPNSVGSVFALSREGLNEALEELDLDYREITYSNEAGIRELQVKKKIDPESVLRRYYD